MFANLKLIALINRLIIKLLFEPVTRAAGERAEKEKQLFSCSLSLMDVLVLNTNKLIWAQCLFNQQEPGAALTPPTPESACV